MCIFLNGSKVILEKVVMKKSQRQHSSSKTSSRESSVFSNTKKFVSFRIHMPARIKWIHDHVSSQENGGYSSKTQEIEFYFLVRGHSYLPPDRVFG